MKVFFEQPEYMIRSLQPQNSEQYKNAQKALVIIWKPYCHKGSAEM